MIFDPGYSKKQRSSRYVRTPTHTVMVQASANRNIKAVKPWNVDVTNALVAKKLPAR